MTYNSIIGRILAGRLFGCPAHIFSGILLICCFSFNTVYSQNSNVTVSATATSGGSWSALTAGVYTFTPTSDNANILYTDIQTRLSTGSVTIVTTNTPGTQAGNVNINTAITAKSTAVTGYTFSVVASGNISVTSAVDIGGGAYNKPGNNLNFTATGNISLTAGISTAGWTGYVNAQVVPAGTISI
ncbi:MAG: hypothetical protein NTV75_00520, partial [Bacteroidia bacterium]|nr:hypothetical protein [Bacteroidia bacterium]